MNKNGPFSICTLISIQRRRSCKIQGPALVTKDLVGSFSEDK